MVNHCNLVIGWQPGSIACFRKHHNRLSARERICKDIALLCVCVCVRVRACRDMRACVSVVRGQPGELVWVKVLASNFSDNEHGEEPMMRNHLFINKREMEQPVLNLKNAKLSKPRLPSPRHSATADGNPACHNHQPLWTKWSIELSERQCAGGALILPCCCCRSM